MTTPDPSPPPGDKATVPKAEPRRVWMRRILVPLNIIVALAVIYALWTSPGKKLVWLNVSGMAVSGHAGPLRDLKTRIEALPLISSMVQHYRDGQPRIMVDCGAFSLPSNATQRLSLGLPDTTNANGLRAWILTSAGSLAFRRDLDQITRTSVPIASSMRSRTSVILLLNGNQGSASTGVSVLVSTNSIFAGLTTAVRAKVISSDIKMSAAITDTEAVIPKSGGLPTLKTNFAAACQAVVPIGGALLIDGGNVNSENGMNRWIMLDVSAMDSKGQAIPGKR